MELLAFAFTERGYAVLKAYDGPAGVELALRHRPDAIISDLIMGEMHGFEVVQTLRAHPELRNTVIIVTSAKAYKPDIDRVRDLGATEYVVKPFVVGDLVALVERHLPAQSKSA